MDCRVDWLISDELWTGLTYQLWTVVELTNLSVMDCGDDWPISYWLWSGLPPCILGLTTQVSIQILILIDCWQKTRNFLPYNIMICTNYLYIRPEKLAVMFQSWTTLSLSRVGSTRELLGVSSSESISSPGKTIVESPPSLVSCIIYRIFSETFKTEGDR